MVSHPLVFVRRLSGQDRIEVTLRAGFTREDLSVVRGLRNRRYDAERRVWTASHAPEAIKTLKDAFGPAAVLVTSGSASDPATSYESGSGREGASPPARPILQQVRDALMVRGYSPRTRIASHRSVKQCSAHPSRGETIRS